MLCTVTQEPIYTSNGLFMQVNGNKVQIIWLFIIIIANACNIINRQLELRLQLYSNYTCIINFYLPSVVFAHFLGIWMPDFSYRACFQSLLESTCVWSTLKLNLLCILMWYFEPTLSMPLFNKNLESVFLIYIIFVMFVVVVFLKFYWRACWVTIFSHELVI